MCLIPSFYFIRIPVLSQVSKWLCICVLVISILSLFLIYHYWILELLCRDNIFVFRYIPNSKFNLRVRRPDVHNN